MQVKKQYTRLLSETLQNVGLSSTTTNNNNDRLTAFDPGQPG